MEELYISCQCSDMGHTVRFSMDMSDGEVWLNTWMFPYDRWYKRLWKALRYVVGLAPTGYGHYDVTTLRHEDYDRIRDLLNRSEIAMAGAQSRAREQRL